MKVEIWSDVMCPFCYIGKRRFEESLAEFGHQDQIEVEWKSFQLQPDLKTDPSLNVTEHLAKVKSWTLDYARQMNAHVTNMAAEVGLQYDFDRAVVANSFNAHRLMHLAHKHGSGDEAKEALLKAYFTEGKNIDDKQTLIEIGVKIGLSALEVDQMLESNAFADEVKHDIAEAQYLGIRGVPFFVLNNKYGISGAQAVPVFLETLNKSFGEWELENTKAPLEIIEGESCGPDGNC